MRARFPAVPCILCLLAVNTSTARADDVTASAVLIRDEGATRLQSTIVGIGIRRGVSAVHGLRYVHPADVLAVEAPPEELSDAVGKLDTLANMVTQGNPDAAADLGSHIVDVFEHHLAFVKRSQLIDAYMLAAVAECKRGRRRQCVEGFEHVITFREGMEYDPVRYPPDYLDLFMQTKDRLLSHGGRGSLQITTDPEGVEVFVDGRSYGPSPTVADGLLAGDHYVTVKAVGFDKLIQRVSVSTNRQGSIALTLDHSERARLLAAELPHVREELGQHRVGLDSRIAHLTNLLYVNQLILGTVTPAAGGQIRVHLYLYDLRTRFLLSEKEASIPADAGGQVLARRLASQLYEGVDLSGSIAAPDQHGTPVVEQESTISVLLHSVWFWLGAAAVVAAGIGIGVYALSHQGGPGVPQGWTRIDGALP